MMKGLEGMDCQGDSWKRVFPSPFLLAKDDRHLGKTLIVVRGANGETGKGVMNEAAPSLAPQPG